MSNITGDFIAGATQATLVTLVGFPFDTIKVKMQSKMYPTNLKCVSEIWKKEGIQGYYKGGSMPFISHLLKRPIQFAFLEPAKEYFKKNYKLSNIYLYNYLIGGVSGPLGSLFGTPLQVVKIRSQTHHISTVDIVKDVWKQRGLSGFYRGLLPTMMKDTLFGASFIGHYYTLRDVVGDDIWYKNFMNGSIAHCLTWALLIPVDFVKTNIQKSDVPISALEVISKNYSKYGIKVFWKGVIPACVRTVPVSGIAMTCYEIVRTYFHDKN